MEENMTYDEIVAAAKLLSVQDRAKLMAEIAKPNRRKGVIKALKIVTSRKNGDQYVRFETEPADAVWMTFRQVAMLLVAVGRSRGLKPIRREEDAAPQEEFDDLMIGKMLADAGVQDEFDEDSLSNFLVGVPVVVVERPTPDGLDVKLTFDREPAAT